MNICSVQGCHSKVYAKGLCEKHYARSRRSNVPIDTLTRFDPNTYRIDGDTLYLDLRNSKKEVVATTLLDKNLLPDIIQYKWYLATRGYVSTRSGGKEKKLHRFITNCEDSLEIDHINGDKLDNRLSNLRICTHVQNSFNQSGNNNNQPGIWFRESRQKWIATIRAGKQRHSKQFNTKEEAIVQRKEWEDKYYGDFGYMKSRGV